MLTPQALIGCMRCGPLLTDAMQLLNGLISKTLPWKDVHKTSHKTFHKTSHKTFHKMFHKTLQERNPFFSRFVERFVGCFVGRCVGQICGAICGAHCESPAQPSSRLSIMKSTRWWRSTKDASLIAFKAPGRLLGTKIKGVKGKPKCTLKTKKK